MPGRAAESGAEGAPEDAEEEADGGGPVDGADPKDRGGAPALVILAAGASRRLGFPKALAPLPGGTPLARLLAAGAALGAGPPPLVVTGADHAAIAAAAPRGVELAENPRWAEGRTGGVQLARRLRPGRDLCLAPVDVPLVPARVFGRLAAAWRAAGAPERGWLAPRHGGAHGHPLVVGRGLLLELDLLAEDEPLRSLRGRAAPLLAAPVEDPEVGDDLDTRADFEALARRLDPDWVSTPGDLRADRAP